MNLLCVRCGTAADGWTKHGIDTCPDCGDESLIEVQTAADLLNELYLRYSEDGESFSEWIKNIRGDE
jgi:predicted  nucleic acid-binding Zn-ribbon protein